MESMAKQRPKTQTPTPTLPPRMLIVNRFAESRSRELESLHTIISTRQNNNFKSQNNKRRRTTGFDNRSTKNRWKKRRKLFDDQIQNKNKNESEDGLLLLPRRIRRRIQLRKNLLDSGFVTSVDGTKRLRTHLWYAKRFTLVKKWGFFIPLGLHGRGKGSRAVLKWFRNGAVLHDASYYTAVQLEGPEDALLSILRMVFVPMPSVDVDKLSASVLSGMSYGCAMLHHVGAPFSQLICPVKYMWRPHVRHDVDTEAGSSPIVSGSDRQLWVWIHAGALDEGLGALRLACQKQRDEADASVNCCSLEGQLAKLEVMGSKAIQILQKILHPTSETSLADRTSSQLQNSFILEHAVHLPPHAILSLLVKDPRDLPKKEPESNLEAASVCLDGDLLKDEPTKHSASTASKGKEKEIISSLWSNSKANSVLVSDSKDLWQARNAVNPPVEENLLCMEKHQKRMDFFNIDILDMNSGVSATEMKGQSSSSCPILLLKNRNIRGSCVGWSLILPLTWVKAFWVPFVNRGAHPVGLREKHWIACDVGLPSFPFDFPDCNAYSCFMAAEAIANDEKMDLRPMAMRPSEVPSPPPWDSIKLAFETEPLGGITQDIYEENSRGERNGCNSLGDAGIKNCDSESLEQDACPFKGFVARTSDILSTHLNDIHGNHLLVFPNKKLGKKTKLLESRDKLELDPERAGQIPLDRKLCFLRVLLRAYKEGAFEEGAVICAPRLTDILLWTSRSDVHEEQLQIPQSLLGTYYTLQTSGKWELQKPKDPVTWESHRWPIGFVTTGFVRGSTIPTAEAFCESTLLAQLRREQWEGKHGKQRKCEIFVLVRNLRSTAYRLALATIVLEQQREDVDFL
ncbi:hypothetical protein IFM89_009594 [Coptis chinensis]|uniref:Uncharacterized protein n=1 Tax=Coptis chinensis TaxID=261450 RepID=A0A835IQK7_9MAGN|nr:hypothetical protein IFM89_009594 [Coptis chinensis]